MKYLKILFVLLISCVSLNLYAGNISSFNQIVFFGDSLSDNGNLYLADYYTLPVSPPYYQGRFSNGPTWAENVGKHYATMETQNFAYGGETINHLPSDSFLNLDLKISLYQYYLENILCDKSHTLFVFWIGGNDYLRGDITNLDKLSSDSVNTIQATIEELISHGGKYFLVLTLPDVSQTPAIRDSGAANLFAQAIVLHNTKLQTAIATLQSEHTRANIQLYDVNALFMDIGTNLSEYNQRYGLHLSNLTDACWTGGNTLRATNLQEEDVAKDLEKTFANRTREQGLKANAPAPKNIDFHALAHQIVTDKQLSIAYTVGKGFAAGVMPCADPDAYVFWDGVHPTRVVHQIVGEEIIKFIDATYS
jgi:phospholipase/lecithinase/hemolysin